MTKSFDFLKKSSTQFAHGLDRLLYLFSAYTLPVVIGLASLLAFLAWDNQFTFKEPAALGISVIQESPGLTAPAQVVNPLRQQPSKLFHDTLLSETPFWFSFRVAPAETASPSVIEFPSRHAVDMACWDAGTLTPLGSGNRQSSVGDISEIKAGFALTLNSALKSGQVLCRTSAIGPARLSVLKWKTDDLLTSAQDFYRKSGLLDGGIIVLALFVLITAMINRSGLYVLFAAWLVINLRMGALSAGWDTQWLGHTIPYTWLVTGRSVTMALYYVLTLTLFVALFKDDIQRIGHGALVRLAQWTCFPLLLLAALLPYSSFLPLIWSISGVGIAMLAFLLVRILQKTQSRVAIWYGTAISMTLIASLYEVISAALGIKGLIGSINSVTAALSSSLLTALAVAEQMRQEHVQRIEAQAKLENTYEAMPIGLFTLDLRGHFISANPALCAMLGPNVLQVGWNTWQQYFTDGAWATLDHMVHGNSALEMEIKGKSIPGLRDAKRFLVKATLARDKIEGSLQDVTEKSRATEELYFLANHDSLTKILNRRGIEKVLNASIAKLNAGGSLALAYLDLDRFKLINDLFGHSAGDEVLQQVCKRVSDMLTDGCYFGRVGGDEFVIVFPDTRTSLATAICRGIVDNIDTLPYRVGERAFNVRGSIGLIEVSVGMKFKDAMSTADRACREAKKGHSDGLVVYESQTAAFQRHEAELKLIAQLSTNTDPLGLYLQMQPIMSLTAPHESLNFEVLLRMRDPNGQEIPTDRLIAAGEASGRMGMIDRWVLSNTLAWINANYSKLKHTKFICLNLSGASLNDEKFLQDVYALLEQNLHVAGQLCLEITESVALHDLANTRRFVDKVRSYGAKVALDDFGAGYTSFSYLKEFTADLLKIDGSFIVNMNQHPANVAIVEAIVNLAKNLGMKVIAEWAEDNATVQTLTEIGVDYVQGFAVARPQNPDMLLSAESSASFIKNNELAEYVYLIGRSDPYTVPVEPMAKTRPVNIH